MEPGTRDLMQTVSTLKFRISETLCSILVCFPTPTIRFPGHSATTNHFLALSAHCPCLSVANKPGLGASNQILSVELLRGGDWPMRRRRGVAKTDSVEGSSGGMLQPLCKVSDGHTEAPFLMGQIARERK